MLVTQFEIKLDASGRLFQEPRTLYEFLVYELIHSLSRGKVRGLCQCGKPIEDRRAGAKYCSESCRQYYNDENKKTKRNKARRQSTESRSQPRTPQTRERKRGKKPTGLHATHE